MGGRDSAGELASASFRRCDARPGFFESFYSNFLALCPEAAPRFAGTDFAHQNKLLRHAVGLLLVFPKQPDTGPVLLQRIADRHSRRDLNVAPALYPPFVDSLIATVKQFDPEFTSEIEDAWRRTVDTGVKYMISRY